MAATLQRLQLRDRVVALLEQPRLQSVHELRASRVQILQLLEPQPPSEASGAELARRSMRVGLCVPGGLVELSQADVEVATALSRGLSLDQRECVELLVLAHQV